MDPHERIFALFDKLETALQAIKEQNAEIKERMDTNEANIADVKKKCDHLEQGLKQEIIDGNDVRKDQNMVLIELQIELEKIRKRQMQHADELATIQTPIPTVPSVSTKNCCSIQ
jgi:chromosome segregation ATPase